MPVVILSKNDNIKSFKNIKQEFKITISWNKYGSEITTQLKNNNLCYMVDPTFRNINRLLVLSSKNSDNNLSKDSFDKYYVPLVEVKEIEMSRKGDIY